MGSTVQRLDRFLPLMIVLSCLVGCMPGKAVVEDEPAHASLPFLLGAFEDDYGIKYAITEQEWRQYPNTIYHIVEWNTDGQYVIAQNDASNPEDGGLWTRIDWVELPGMPPYEWAFCLSAYKAPTAAEAEQANIAQRETPRTGCNGYPFSRMRKSASQ